jgi:hypothetical protein
MKDRTKVKVRMAVKDYFAMFPEDWELTKPEIERMRSNLKNQFAGLDETHGIKRALFSVPEKLSTMIGMKLTTEEANEFRGKEAARWFADEFKQFSITKNV